MMLIPAMRPLLYVHSAPLGIQDPVMRDMNAQAALLESIPPPSPHLLLQHVSAALQAPVAVLWGQAQMQHACLALLALIKTLLAPQRADFASLGLCLVLLVRIPPLYVYPALQDMLAWYGIFILPPPTCGGGAAPVQRVRRGPTCPRVAQLTATLVRAHQPAPALPVTIAL